MSCGVVVSYNKGFQSGDIFPSSPPSSTLSHLKTAQFFKDTNNFDFVFKMEHCGKKST